MNIYRGAFSYIGTNARIGENVKIYPHAYIGDNVVIGDNTILHPGVKIYADTKIGHNCVIHSGAVIGSDGFGFAPQEDGSYKTIPQLGTVTIEDNVAIGANTVIDCATLFGDSTIIRQGVKLDNLIQVAHNVEIGKNTVIAAQTGISGSTKIGENCLFAGQVGVAGHLTIANNTHLGAQSGISKSIKEEGLRLMGYPAFDFSLYFKSYAVFKKLPDINYLLKELENKIQTTLDSSASND
jgi:UDP-3-O-[3-hydroxymyristoyl] glucosamine N-acyltransferase